MNFSYYKAHYSVSLLWDDFTFWLDFGTVKTLDKSLPNHLFHSNFDLQMDQIWKKNHLRTSFGFYTPFLVMIPTVRGPIQTTYELNSGRIVKHVIVKLFITNKEVFSIVWILTFILDYCQKNNVFFKLRSGSCVLVNRMCSLLKDRIFFYLQNIEYHAFLWILHIRK